MKMVQIKAVVVQLPRKSRPVSQFDLRQNMITKAFILKQLRLNVQWDEEKKQEQNNTNQLN